MLTSQCEGRHGHIVVGVTCLPCGACGTDETEASACLCGLSVLIAGSLHLVSVLKQKHFFVYSSRSSEGGVLLKVFPTCATTFMTLVFVGR